MSHGACDDGWVGSGRSAGDRTVLGWHARRRTADTAVQRLRQVLLLSAPVLPLLRIPGRALADHVGTRPADLVHHQLPPATASPSRRPPDHPAGRVGRGPPYDD